MRMDAQWFNYQKMLQKRRNCKDSKTKSVKSQVKGVLKNSQEVHMIDEHLAASLTTHVTQEMEIPVAQKVEGITTTIHKNKELSHVVVSFNGNNLDFLNDNFNLVPGSVNINCSQEDDTCEFFNPYGSEEF